MIGKALKKKREWRLIAIKSIVPHGTTEKFERYDKNSPKKSV